MNKHIYSWFNADAKQWQVGEKSVLDYLRLDEVHCYHVESVWVRSKKAAKKYEDKILRKNLSDAKAHGDWITKERKGVWVTITVEGLTTSATDFENLDFDKVENLGYKI